MIRSFLLVSILTLHLPLFAQSGSSPYGLGVDTGLFPPKKETPSIDKGEVVSQCKEEYDHEKLYNFGKSLSIAWDDYTRTPPKKNGKVYLPNTRDSVFILSLVKLVSNAEIQNKKSKNPLSKDDLDLVGMCWMMYVSTASKHPWSSVHSGFVDYLSPRWKKYFLSLPER